MYNRATGTSSGAQGAVSVNIPAENADKTLPDVVPDKGSALWNRVHLGTDSLSMENFHPFKSQAGLLTRAAREVGRVLAERRARRVMFIAVLNVLCTLVLFVWCRTTRSMALLAYTYLTVFDILCLVTCLVSIWVSIQKPTPAFSFGYERFEVLAVFTSTTLAQLAQLFVVKESIERLLHHHDVHTGRLLVGTAFGFAVHFVSTYFVSNKAFQHVSEASSSSWLQEHVADMSRSLCSVVPGLSSLLLPRINPLPLIAVAGALALFITDMLIEINNYFRADTFAAISIAIMTIGTMFPMSVYSGRILLQTTPSHIIGQLDKCLREASTLDGVLEFRNEHFWTVSFGTLAGSLHVRIRRDANEQMVLAHVSNRLSNLVTVLTIHIFKDDWTRASLSASSYAASRQPYTSTPAKTGLDPAVPTVNPFQPLPPLHAPNLSTITPIGSPTVPSLHQPASRLYGSGTTVPSHVALGPAGNPGGRIPLRTYQPTNLFGASDGSGQKSTTEFVHR
ncbi:PREDICTED: zinc transporter 6-like isoform X2 [Branchiostoma belcheri]|uniref:Zinc transporter 6-like isoform X1 n=1 Tax=Branchiostoma belcheri TaxID=7741 RepID=A0A6P5ALD3_BRABE|nr:PREDICTED: zinc transporter 6-like isoform X1 [Branchiostoma belcheri]XP_019643882.1 PREDICTED: zinc transporter 6-like isoform X2 [Branchiostoma belcheri]